MYHVLRVVLGYASTRGVVAYYVLHCVAIFYVINDTLEYFLADISAQGSVVKCALKITAMCTLINEMLK